MSNKGLTFLEIVIALFLFVIVMVGFLQIFNIALDASHRATQEIIATNLARGLMAEIMSKNFADPEYPMNDIGSDGTESRHGSNGNAYDDVDDYDGLFEPPYTPPKTVGGLPMDDYLGFIRKVNVVFCDIVGSDIVEVAGTAYDTSNYKQITVTVNGPYTKDIIIDEVKAR